MAVNTSGIIMPKGHVEIKVFNKHNELIKKIGNHNLVMNSGLSRITKALTSDTRFNINKIGCGSGSVVPTQMDTNLYNPEFSADISGKISRGNKAIFGSYFGFEHVADDPICEFGLFAEGDVLFARTTIADDKIIKTLDNAFSITWTIEFLTDEM